MDRPIPQAEINQERNSKYIKTIIIVVSIIAIILFMMSFLTPSIDRKDILTATVTKGPISEMLNASGLVVPIYEENLVSPVQTNIKSIALNQGSSVKPMQTILELGTEDLLNQYSQLKDQYELKKNEKQKLNVSLEKNLIDLETQYSIKKLQIESLEKKEELEKKLTSMGAGSQQNYDIAKLDLSVGKMQLLQLDRQIENLKKTLTVDLNEKNLELKILKKQLDEMDLQIAESSIHSKRSGNITWINSNIGSQVQKGEIVAKVADLSAFKIEAKASEMVADRIFNGQAAIVEINGSELEGTIANINPAISGGTVTFYVELKNSSNDLLRSNLRVDVYAITSYKPEALLIKNGAFFTKKSNLNIFVIIENEAIRKTVSVGLTNYKTIELIGDISPGDKIIISNTSRYEHLDKIEMND